MLLTGELLDIERVPSSSERGRWKSACQGNSLAAYSISRTDLRGGGDGDILALPGGPRQRGPPYPARVVLTEPDAQVRSTLGSFALLFAELAGRAESWKQALEGWDMRTSQVVEEWRNEGRV